MYILKVTILMLQFFSRSSLFDTIAKYALGTILLLLPILFSPFATLGSASLKYLLLVVCTGIATIAYMLARVGDGKIVLPNKKTSILLALLPVVFIVSAIFTGRFSDSFFGFGYESTTVLSIILFVLLTFLTSIYASNAKTVSRALILVATSFGLVTVYQVARLFLPANTLTFGQFGGVYGSMLGSWNDIAIYLGAALIALYVYAKNKKGLALYGVMAAILLIGLFINIIAFGFIWPILALMAIIAVVADSKNSGKITLFKKKGITIYRAFGLLFAALAVVYLAVTMIAARPNSQGLPLHPNVLKIVYVLPIQFGVTPDYQATRPSFIATTKLLATQIKQNVLFGSGPNRFNESWVQNRPAAMFQTPYWNTDFAFGIGYIPTLAVTTGLLGLLVLIAFCALFLFKSIRVAMSESTNAATRTIALIAVYLLILSIVYVPSIILLVFLFVAIGFVLAQETDKTVIDIKSSLMQMIFVLYICICALIFAIAIFFLVQEYRSVRQLALASLAVSETRDLDKADTFLKKAIQIKSRDVYYRAFANVSLLKSQVIVSQATQNGAKLTEEARAAALGQITTAQKYADAAIQKNPSNYSNYIFAGSVYESNPEFAVKATDLYTQSMKYNPNNPDGYFGIAKVKANGGDIAGTKEYIQKALTARPAYTNGLLAAAQISGQDKDIEGTIALLVRAYQSDQTKSDILVNIANLQLEVQKDSKAATQTMEFAVYRHPNYLEARYALSVLYAQQGNFKDAAALLSPIVSADPKTAEALTPIIEKLEAGINPFVRSTQSSSTATSTKNTTATTTKAVVKKVEQKKP